MTKNNRL